ncbi:MAG: transposase [Gemmataceae bacterium]
MILGISASEANGTAERDEATKLAIELHATHGRKPKTLGADKGYDDGDFLHALELLGIEPHIPLKREPADPKTVMDKTRLPGIKARRRMKRRLKKEAYRLSQMCRKKVEECFGWLKVVAGLCRSKVVGRWKLRQAFQIGAAAFNLVKMVRLAPAT